jgi:hypothetical protein
MEIFMELRSGSRLNPLDPSSENIEVSDIAFSLARHPRFCGQSIFYSVAQHSVYVSKIIENLLGLEWPGCFYSLYGLLHDSAEAYIADIPRPVKHNIGAEILDLEKQLFQKILDTILWEPLDSLSFIAGHLNYYGHRLSKLADITALKMEGEELFGEGITDDWNVPLGLPTNLPPPEPLELTGSFSGSETEFLDRYYNHLQICKGVSPSACEE